MRAGAGGVCIKIHIYRSRETRGVLARRPSFRRTLKTADKLPRKNIYNFSHYNIAEKSTKKRNLDEWGKKSGNQNFIMFETFSANNPSSCLAARCSQPGTKGGLIFLP